MIKLRLLLLLFSTLWLSSCGGGGSSSGSGSASTTTNKTAIVKLACNEPFTANLVGLQITISLPSGVAVATDANGLVLPSVVVPSGVTTNNAVIPVTLMIYTAPTATTDGSLSFVLASTAAKGFGSGEFATVTLTVANGSNPSAGSIVLSGFKPIDGLGNLVEGLTPTLTANFQ